MRGIMVLLAVAAVGGCNDPASSGAPSRAEVAAVRVGDILYVQTELSGEHEPGAVVATVVRQISCDGVEVSDGEVITDVCLFEDGDAHLLAAGTSLHGVAAEDPGKWLMALHRDEWVVLRADPDYVPGQLY